MDPKNKEQRIVMCLNIKKKGQKLINSQIPGLNFCIYARRD